MIICHLNYHCHYLPTMQNLREIITPGQQSHNHHQRYVGSLLHKQPINSCRADQWGSDIFSSGIAKIVHTYYNNIGKKTIANPTGHISYIVILQHILVTFIIIRHSKMVPMGNATLTSANECGRIN